MQTSTDAQVLCTCCGSAATSALYTVESVPVQSCILLDTHEAARDFPRHSIRLRFCDTCGFIYNSTFDERLVDYASTTEESQHFSGTFNRFAEELVREVAGAYDLKGRRVLEIGCGKGDFLQGLAEETGCIGLGVDPGFIPERLPVKNGVPVTFQREYFDPAHISEAPDFVACRHTLEHIGPVGAFVQDIRKVIGGREDVGVLFETPDMRRVLEEGAFWDIYFEHCSYFTSGSHARLFRQEGFDVTGLYLAYDDQYIIQYATSAADQTAPRLDIERDLDAVRALAAAFPARVREVQERWADFTRSRHEAGKRVAIWGGGSKGVSFLTTTGIARWVEQVVDVNPFKQGKFLPGTGHRVSSPQDLVAAPPDTVVVMNPIYLIEIGEMLDGLGLRPELVAA